MFILIKSGLGLYLGHLGSKTRSLCQIIEKPCVDNRGHSFHSIFMKFGQNVYLDEIWVGIVLGHLGSEIRSRGQIIENLVLYKCILQTRETTTFYFF